MENEEVVERSVVEETAEPTPEPPSREEVAAWRPVHRGLVWLQAALIVALVVNGVVVVALISFPGFPVVNVVMSGLSLVPCALLTYALVVLRRGGPDADAVRRSTRAALFAVGWAVATLVTTIWGGVVGYEGPGTSARELVDVGGALLELGAIGYAVALLDGFAVRVGRFDVCVTYKRLPAVVWMLAVVHGLQAAIVVDGATSRDAAALQILLLMTLLAGWFTLLGAFLAMTARLRRVLPFEAPVATTFE